ncbi:MAG: hypothetical protein AB7O62_20670 [Pirellulales bacterium]
MLLRLGCGWHFLQEGIWKRENPSFSAAGFLRQSRGPLRDRFLNLIPDIDGQERLSPETMSQRWEAYLHDFETRYELSEDQKINQAKRIYDNYEGRLSEFLKDNKEEIEKYQQGLEKLAATRADKATGDMPYMVKRLYDQETELRSQAKPWLDYVDKLDANYRQDLQQVVSDAQRKRGGGFTEPESTLDRMDNWLGIGIAAIGACLMLGLFTRLASFAGALFLLSVVLAQPYYPGVFPAPHPSGGHPLFISKEVIELLALVALACSPVGRWGGLDFFIHYGIIRPLFGKRQ